MESGRQAARPGWVTRLVEVVQPVSVRAGRLGSTELFAKLEWSELEFMAGVFRETLIDRGTRLMVQGQPCPRLWLILEGQVLVSADARPIRVAGGGDMVGLTSLLHGGRSPETAIALAPVRAFEADAEAFARMAVRPAIRERLVAAEAASPGWSKRAGSARRRRAPAASPAKDR
jgi:CRP-like cAMP-binding protein